jgi:hypothetical protein
MMAVSCWKYGGDMGGARRSGRSPDSHEHTIGVRLVYVAREPTLHEHGEEKLRNAGVDLEELVALGERFEGGKGAHEWLRWLEAAHI